MTKRKLILLVVLWTLAFFVGYLGFTKVKNNPNRQEFSEIFVGKKLSVKRIQILKGDFFDILLFEKEQRILAKLSVMATDDSKQKVLDMMHHSSNPKILIKGFSTKNDGYWIVDIFFVHEEKELSLTEWLTENNFIYKSS